jgi:phosphoribosylaminoimidazolecarboxamide formyltransferase/IMP cyclohydrolase
MGKPEFKKYEDLVKVRNVIVSTADKRGLGDLATRLVDLSPQVRFYATGGTHAVVREALGPRAAQRVVEMNRYTTQPVTHAGLARTIDFKIYIGLLADPFNPVHVLDLSSAGAAFFDMVISNVHLHSDLLAAGEPEVEVARSNIDIGGPGMIRAGVRNFLRVAVLSDPDDYARVLDHLREHGGATTLDLRLELARKAFRLLSRNDAAIADYLDRLDGAAVRAAYEEVK